MRAKFRSSHFRTPFSGTSGEVSPAPERVVHFGRSLPIALIAALLIAGVAAIDVVPASAGPTASVAKKKCSKEKRKQLKCGPVAALTALFAGSSFSYSVPGDAGSYSTGVAKFCRNGTYQGQYAITGSAGADHVLTNSGTWKFTAAHVVGLGSSSSLDGNLHQTNGSWQDTGPGANPPVQQAAFDSSVKHPSGASYITMQDYRWTISPGGAGC